MRYMRRRRYDIENPFEKFQKNSEDMNTAIFILGLGPMRRITNALCTNLRRHQAGMRNLTKNKDKVVKILIFTTLFLFFTTFENSLQFCG